VRKIHTDFSVCGNPQEKRNTNTGYPGAGWNRDWSGYKWVICDRYLDATTVYQGVALEHYDRLIEVVNREATLDCQPDITFLLDCPAEVGQKRIAKRAQHEKKRDRFERKTLDFHIKLRYGYLTLANKHKDRFRIIDGTVAEEQVAKRIREIIDPYFPTKL